MNDFWTQRSERERLILVVGAVILALALVFQLAVAPFLSWRRGAESSLADSQSVYELVRQAAARAPQAAAGGAASDRPLRGAVTAMAQEAGVTLIFVNVRTDGAVEATAGPTPPEALFGWIRDLAAREGANVVYADIARTSETDATVRGRLIFSK